MNIKTKSMSLLTKLESGQVILTKSADDKAILERGNSSIYDSSREERVVSARASLTTQAALDLIPEVSSETASSWDHPIVDGYRIQAGFDGDTSVVGEAHCAESKAILAAEGLLVREGTIHHVQVHSSFNSTVGAGASALNDAVVSKRSRASFARRSNEGGYDKATTINLKRINATGLAVVSPYDPADPCDPDMLNQLSSVAGGIAYTAANESFYADAHLLSEQEKLNALLVTTRNANAAILDRTASDAFVAAYNLDLTAKQDRLIHKALMDAFRDQRSLIGVRGNNVLSTTMTIGLVDAKYSYADTMVWTSEKKVGKVKKLVDSAGAVFYMASSYDQAGCFTVPVDIQKLTPSTRKMIQQFALQASIAANNEAAHILGLPGQKLDSAVISSLSSLANAEVPTVADALRLEQAEVSRAKEMILEGTQTLVKTIIENYREGVYVKAASKYAEDSLG